MSEDEYIAERLDDQIEWYSARSKFNQQTFKRLRLLEIIAAACIPFLTGMSQKIAYSEWIIGFLGIAIAVAAAATSLYKLQENWIQYRSTCEQLQHEKYLYLTRTAPYADEDRLSALVQRVEGLIATENSAWSQQYRQDGELES